MAEDWRVPRLAPVGQMREHHLIAACWRWLTVRGGPGNRIDHALHLDMHIGADVLFDQCVLSFYYDATVALAIILVFVAQGVFRPRRTGTHQEQPAGQNRTKKKRL